MPQPVDSTGWPSCVSVGQPQAAPGPVTNGSVHFATGPGPLPGWFVWLPCTPAMPSRREIDAKAQADREAAAGDRLYQSGAWPEALAHYQKAVAILPARADFHYKLAYCAWQAGNQPLVEPGFRTAVRLDPRHAWAHEGLALWLLHRDRQADAMAHSQAALDLEPANPDFIVTRAYVLAAQKRPAEAWQVLAPVLEDRAVADRAAVLYARIAPSIGRAREAADWALRQLQADGFRSPVRPRLHFALAALLERLGRYDEAFAQARLAHQLAPRHFDRAGHRAWTDHKIQTTSRKQISSLPRATHGSRRPVFIVGMLRSGTSLVEQVLSSHSQVYGAGELDHMTRWVAPLMWEMARRAGGIDRLAPADLNQVASRYLAELHRHEAAAKYVVDKMPLNFVHLDLIQMLFPDCHVIHCTRVPIDTCVSCYMTDFAQQHPFAGTLADMGSFYRDYQRLMSHWKHVLDLPVLDVSYEEMVGDLEGQSSRILNFLGLPWEEQCLNFHENCRPVITASREQVRKPIYRSSVGRGAHYARHLGPLTEFLHTQTRRSA